MSTKHIERNIFKRVVCFNILELLICSEYHKANLEKQYSEGVGRSLEGVRRR